MLRPLADENSNGDIVRGLLLQQPNIDLIRVQDVGLMEADDRNVLAWAAANERILLTHDRATIPDLAHERIATDEGMPGIFLINDRLPVGEAIRGLMLIIACSEQAEWSGQTVFVPL
jgi:hypothetical protein